MGTSGSQYILPVKRTRPRSVHSEEVQCAEGADERHDALLDLRLLVRHQVRVRVRPRLQDRRQHAAQLPRHRILERDYPEVQRYVIVRSPFRAKHHVVVQYMAGWMKCPLSPPLPTPPPDPLPDPPSPCQTPPPHREDKEDKEESMTLLAGKGLCTAVALSTASCFGKEEQLNSHAVTLKFLTQCV